MEIHELIEATREWGKSRGIIGANGKGTEQSQFNKLLEEVGELSGAIRENDQVEKIDAVGDCAVVLILLAEIIDVPFEECLASAYAIITKRTGKMVNGTFIKD